MLVDSCTQRIAIAIAHERVVRPASATTAAVATRIATIITTKMDDSVPSPAYRHGLSLPAASTPTTRIATSADPSPERHGRSKGALLAAREKRYDCSYFLPDVMAATVAVRSRQGSGSSDRSGV
jgi:hypothetical protein